MDDETRKKIEAAKAKEMEKLGSEEQSEQSNEEIVKEVKQLRVEVQDSNNRLDRHILDSQPAPNTPTAPNTAPIDNSPRIDELTGRVMAVEERMNRPAPVAVERMSGAEWRYFITYLISTALIAILLYFMGPRHCEEPVQPQRTQFELKPVS